MNVRETLEAARKLIADPANWKQNGLAEISQTSEVIGPFCSLGSLAKVSEIFGLSDTDGGRDGVGVQGKRQNIGLVEKNNNNEEVRQTYFEAVELLNECLDAPSVHEFNDTHDHDCVLAAFDAAIEKARKQEMAAC